MTTKTVAKINHAASIDDLLKIKELIKEFIGSSQPSTDNSQSLNEQDDHGNTALNLAAQNGHLNLVQYLIEEVGFDASQQNSYGNTALHVAAMYDRLNIAELLKENGADVNISNKKSNKNGRKALDYNPSFEKKLKPKEAKKSISSQAENTSSNSNNSTLQQPIAANVPMDLPYNFSRYTANSQTNYGLDDIDLHNQTPINSSQTSTSNSTHKRSIQDPQNSDKDKRQRISSKNNQQENPTNSTTDSQTQTNNVVNSDPNTIATPISGGPVSSDQTINSGQNINTTSDVEGGNNTRRTRATTSKGGRGGGISKGGRA